MRPAKKKYSRQRFRKPTSWISRRLRCLPPALRSGSECNVWSYSMTPESRRYARDLDECRFASRSRRPAHGSRLPSVRNRRPRELARRKNFSLCPSCVGQLSRLIHRLYLVFFLLMPIGIYPSLLHHSFLFIVEAEDSSWLSFSLF